VRRSRWGMRRAGSLVAEQINGTAHVPSETAVRETMRRGEGACVHSYLARCESQDRIMSMLCCVFMLAAYAWQAEDERLDQFGSSERADMVRQDEPRLAGS
jgi:hypothetical protein